MPANRDLYDALLALIELGNATKPQRSQDGRSSQPVLGPLPAHIAFRLALCRNSLRPIGEAYEEQLSELRAAHGLKQPLTGPDGQRQVAEAIRTYTEAVRQLERQEVAWSPPATVRLQQLADRPIPDAWLAAWASVGIIVDEPEPQPEKR
jgi:hypothetical protein